MTKPKISILLPAYKSKDLLKKVFLPSFLRNTSVKTEVILYDNGGNGKLDFENYFSAFKWEERVVLKELVKIIGNGTNIGLNAALNECVKVATGEWFYLPHTDMVLLNWDKPLLETTKNEVPWNMVLCSRSIEKQSHIPMQLLKDFGTDLETFDEKGLYNFVDNEYKDKGVKTGYRMPYFFHRKLSDKMADFNAKNGICSGPFDDNLFSFGTDNDLFFTAYHACGVRKFWMCYESIVYHLSGHSNNQQSVDKGSLEPYRYLVNKWNSFCLDINMNMDASEQKLIPWNVKIK